MIFNPEKCPVCDEGTWLPKCDGIYSFRYGRKVHEVAGQHYALCAKCGTRGYLPGQRDENRAQIRRYQDSLPGFISPSDVLAVREKYMLTQKDASLIFGGGVQSFSKWERGTASPAGPTARLIKLALNYPEVMQALAKEVGSKIPDNVIGMSKPKQDVRVVYVFQEEYAIGEMSSAVLGSCDDDFDLDNEVVGKWTRPGKAVQKNRALHS